MELLEFELMTIDRNFTAGCIVHLDGMPIVDNFFPAGVVMNIYWL